MASQPSVLVVEDDHDLLEILSRRFSRRGYRVTAVDHPRHALAAANQYEYEFAIVDHKLPEISGFDLMERLLMSGHMRVIVLTGRAEASVSDEAAKRGAYRLMFKPCRLADLEEAMEEALQSDAKSSALHAASAN